MADEPTPMKGGKDQTDPVTSAANKIRQEWTEKLQKEIIAQIRVVNDAGDVYENEKAKLRQMKKDAREKRAAFDKRMIETMEEG